MKIHWETTLSKAMATAVALASLCACGSAGSGVTGVGSGTSGCATNPACKAQSIDSVAYGAGIYVAGGSGGLGSGAGNSIGPWMETSTDGVSWKVIDAGDSTPQGDIASIAYGSKGFMALDVPGNKLYFSADAKTWKDVTPANVPKGELFTVDWDGSEYIAYGGVPYYESQDGRTWTPFPYKSPNVAPFSIRRLPGAYYALWLGGGSTAADQFATSSDLATWTPYSETFAGFTPGTESPSQMIYAGGLLMAVGGHGFIATSPDGTTWTGDSTGDRSDNFLQVAYNGTVYVTVGDCGSVDTSPDGTTWTKVDITGLLDPSNTDDCLMDITAASGGAFVAIAGTGGITSMDGIHWRAIKF